MSSWLAQRALTLSEQARYGEIALMDGEQFTREGAMWVYRYMGHTTTTPVKAFRGSGRDVISSGWYIAVNILTVIILLGLFGSALLALHELGLYLIIQVTSKIRASSFLVAWQSLKQNPFGMCIIGVLLGWMIAFRTRLPKGRK